MTSLRADLLIVYGLNLAVVGLAVVLGFML